MRIGIFAICIEMLQKKPCVLTLRENTETWVSIFCKSPFANRKE
jgi:hypothetical protein